MLCLYEHKKPQLSVEAMVECIYMQIQTLRYANINRIAPELVFLLVRELLPGPVNLPGKN